MTRSKEAGKPFFVYLPYAQVHVPPIPDPEYVGKTKRGNWGDILTQMDDFTGAVVGGLDDDRVVPDPQLVELVEHTPEYTDALGGRRRRGPQQIG